MVKAMDSRGRLMDAEEYALFQQAYRGQAYGVKIEYRITSNEYPVVTQVASGSVAATAGITAGDQLLMVEDHDPMELSSPEIRSILRGPAEQTVFIKIRHADEVEEEYNLEREPVQLSSVDFTETFPEELEYMKINGLYEDDGSGIAEQLHSWQTGGVFGVIMDLRNASGDSLDAVQLISSCFVASGKMLLVYRDRDDQDLDIMRADASAGKINIPIMLLINGKTCGAAELLAAVMRNSTRGALLIGRPTAGDFLIRKAIPLESGDQVYMVTRKLVLADGQVYSGSHGVTPDVAVPGGTVVAGVSQPEWPESNMSEEEKADKWLHERVRDDPVLRRAVDLLLGLKALDIHENEETRNTSR
jgi:C-terminal peptidase prc